MGGLLLAALKDQVRSLCFEESTDLGLFTEARLADIIQIAHREQYGFVARVAPVELATQSADLPITSSGLTFATIDSSAGVHDIYRVELKDVNGNYSPLQYVPFNDIGVRGSNSADEECDIRWTRLGQTIHLVPEQSSTETCRVLYVKSPVAIDDAASYPFNGALPQFHHLISFRAADIAMTKDEKPSKYAATYGQMKRELEEHLRRPHASGPRKVRMNPHGD